MKYTYPHMIDNGNREQITFLNFVDNEAGGMLELENQVEPGAGPPMHVHHMQDESLTVVRGRIAAQALGQQPTFHGVGETVTFKQGVAHRFWNAGDEILVCRGWVRPAYSLETFLTEIYSSMKVNGKRPSTFDSAYLQDKYKSEFELLAIPAFVKKVIFPVVLIFGRLLGKHRKFE